MDLAFDRDNVDVPALCIYFQQSFQLENHNLVYIYISDMIYL
jgi:hypothetical protein